MSVGVGFPFMSNQDPCAASPLISSLGTVSVGNAGDCSVQDLELDILVTLSASLPAGYTLERRTYFGTSSTPSYGSWADSGLSDTGTYTYGAGLFTTTPNANPSSTYYYNVQFRITGTDGTTVCDGPDTATQWSGTVYQCFA